MPGIRRINNIQQCTRSPICSWTRLLPTADFATTAPTTSTITMNIDWTAIIAPGMALRYVLLGTTYYGMVESIAAALLTINGAPLSLGAGDLQELYFSYSPGRVKQLDFFIQGNFADGADANLLINDMEQAFRWQGAAARIVKISHYADTPDSGAAQPRVNVTAGGAAVCTSNGNAGRAIATPSAWEDTVVDISTANYGVAYEEALEISTDANGTNNDAADLSVSVVLVMEA